MKIAIVGMGPAGLEASLHFYQLGAELKIFEMNAFGGILNDLPQDFLMEGSWKEITSELGRNFSGLNTDLSIQPTVRDYLSLYFNVIISKLNLVSVTKKALIKRVHKRFLQVDQEIAGASRMRDLFRAVYTQEVVIDEENLDYYKELVTKLGQEVVSSLKESIEHYEDFDVIIDCTGPYSKPLLAGPSGTYAIGEERLKNSSQLAYGLKSSLQKIKNLLLVDKEDEITIYGTTVESALVLSLIGDWIFSKGHHLRLLSIETNPFESLIKSKTLEEKDLGEKALKVLEKNNRNFEADKKIFEQKVEDWKNLEDYVQAKIPKPAEPMKRIDVVIGGVITALDKLIDQEKLFLTVEFPEFLINNASSDLITIGSDLLFILNGHESSSSIAHGLRANGIGPIHAEAGFYSLQGSSNKIISDLNLIEADLLQYFSRT